MYTKCFHINKSTLTIRENTLFCLFVFPKGYIVRITFNAGNSLKLILSLNLHLVLAQKGGNTQLGHRVSWRE